MESIDTKKRGSSTDETEQPTESSKRAAVDDGFHFKILCPSTAIGSIIGKGGAVINALNQSTGAKIRVSQTNEYYPGTNDRVIAMCGDLPNLYAAISDIILKIVENDKRTHEIHFDTYGNPIPSASSSSSQPLLHEIRCLVPTGSSGTIIGRSGATIKALSDRTGCRMKLSENSDPFDTRERVMIFRAADGSTLIQGIQASLAQLVSDPTTCVYHNTRTTYSNSMARGGGGGAGMGMRGDPNPMHPMGGYSPYSPYMYSPHGHPSYPPAPSLSSSGALVLPEGVSPPSFTTDGVSITMTMGLENGLIGAVLGRGGQVVKDMIGATGSSIKVSQKDDLLPGTNQRYLRVTGSQGQVQHALSLIIMNINSHISLQAMQQQQQGLSRGGR